MIKTFTIEVDFEEGADAMQQFFDVNGKILEQFVGGYCSQSGVIADPQFSYDPTKRWARIERTPADKGKVFIKPQKDIVMGNYKDVKSGSNYAMLDPLVKGYRLYVKQDGVDHPVNVAFSEEELLTLFDGIKETDLVPDVQEDVVMEVIRDDG
jgi:hypothetical protein